jgi:hypothetical protein
MKVDDLPGIEFTSCDVCRLLFNSARPPNAVSLRRENNQFLTIGVCAACFLTLMNDDRATAERAGKCAEATARLRPGRLWVES